MRSFSPLFPSLGIDGEALGFIRRLYGYKWLPSRIQAADDWLKLKEDVKNGSFIDQRVDWTDEWFVGLQRKYRPSPDVAIHSPVGHSTPKIILGLYIQMLPDKKSALVRRTLEALNASEVDNGTLIPILKKLKELAFKHGKLLFPGYWEELCDLHNFFGAQPENEEALLDFESQVAAWVHDEKVEDAATSSRHKLIMRGLDIIEKMCGKAPRGPSLDEFLKDSDSWVTSGASTVKGVKGARKTKASAVATLDRSSLLALMFEMDPVVYSVLIKRERTKLRNLVTSPMSLHMQMSFIGSTLERHLWKFIPSSLRKDFGLKHWIRWQQRMNKVLYVPIDQSKFDHVPSGKVLARTFSVLCNMCTHEVDSERMQISRIMQKRLKEGTVLFNGKQWAHRRGVLSGWRWTSVVDTVINAAEHYAIAEMCAVPLQSPQYNCYQGDDTLIATTGWDMAASLVEAYTHVLPVNPQKFFLNDYRTEYLRMVLFREGECYWRRRGYPARAVMSLIFANAWSGGTLTPSSLVESWSRLASRMGPGNNVHKHCVRDLCGLLRCSWNDAVAVITTPKYRKGLGYHKFPIRSRYAKGIVEPVVSEGNDRLSKITDVDKLDKRLVAEVTQNRTTIYDGDPLVGEASARNLLRSLQGLQKLGDTRSEIVDAGQDLEWWNGAVPGRALPKAPNITIPRSIWAEIIKMNPRDFDIFSRYLVNSDDYDWFFQWYQKLPRWLFIDWVSGTIKKQISSCWTAAGDVMKHVGQTVRKVFKVLPKTSYIRTTAVRERIAYLEICSRPRYTQRLLSFGA